MRKKILILLLLIPFIYVNTDYFIKKHTWKSLSTNQISDFLEFDNSNLKNHVIYGKNNKKVGLILLSFYKIIVIKKIDDGVCIYYNYN